MSTAIARREVDDLADSIRSNITKGKRGLESAIEAYFAIGRDLLEAKSKLPHGEWLPWLKREFDQSERWAQQLMLGAKHEAAVREQIRTQVRISGVANFKEALATVGGTRRYLATADDWYTPEKYIESVRKVLGEIDLDPASSECANKVVRAKRIFTIEEDGLSKPWKGRVFLNPPYSNASNFIEKLIEEYEGGHTKAAITLLSVNTTSVAWFQLLWKYSHCITNHRISFYFRDQERGSNSPFGSVFSYLGQDPDAFQDQFEQWGAVVVRRRRDRR